MRSKQVLFVCFACIFLLSLSCTGTAQVVSERSVNVLFRDLQDLEAQLPNFLLSENMDDFFQDFSAWEARFIQLKQNIEGKQISVGMQEKMSKMENTREAIHLLEED